METVAVKVYLNTLNDRFDTLSTSDLVAMSTKPNQLLHAFKEIRQEVSVVYLFLHVYTFICVLILVFVFVVHLL